MALLNNLTMMASHPYRRTGSAAGNTVEVQRSTLGIQSFQMLTPFASDAGWDSQASFPVGWQFGNGWLPPLSGGGAWGANLGRAALAGQGGATGAGELAQAILAVATLAGLSDVSGNLAGGRNAVATLAGTGDLDAAGLLAYFAQATLSGSGGVSAADLRGIGSLASTLAGEGNLTGLGQLASVLLAAATLTGQGDVQGAGQLVQGLAAAATLTGSGAIQASIGALAGLAATLTGVGGSTGLPRASGSLSASLVVTGTGLTTSNVGSAVWSAVAALNNNPGSMGEKLNDAGSAANPWTEIIEGTLTAEQVLRILLAVLAGDAEIQSMGGGVTRMRFRDQADSKDRLVADLTAAARDVTSTDPD